MALNPHTLRRLRTAAIWIAIVGAGAAVGWSGYRDRRDEIISRLIDDVRRAAVALDPAELRGLSGTAADVGTPGYERTKERLLKLHAADGRVRSVHLHRYVPQTGLVVRIGDSTRPTAPGGMLPGDSLPAASLRPGLQAIIRSGEPAVDGPRADDSGRVLIAYALADEVPAGIAGLPRRDILAIEFEIRRWWSELVQAGFQGALYVWLLLGLPFGAWRILRRQGEQREVIRNLSEAMEQSHSAILIIDLDHHIEYANRGLCRQMGYSRRELIGRNWRELRSPQTGEQMFADLAATTRAGRIWHGELFLARKDSTSYPVRGVVTPVKHPDSSLSCYVAVFDDVSDAKRRETELREARDLAEAGDRAKGQFLAMMSHEVRTPLNGIIGFTSLLLDTALSSEQREYVQTIRSSGEALIQLTGDILDYARIDSGKLKLEPLPVDPRDCVEDALDLLAAKAAEKDLELLHHCVEDVPSAVMADGGRLRQILVNLIGNAVKFTDHGEIEVVVAVAAADSAGRTRDGSTPDPAALPGSAVAAESGRDPQAFDDSAAAAGVCWLEFSVRDTGIGIPADQHARLFKPFSQLDDSSTRRYSGTGLGLAICRNLVALMDGSIAVESRPGEGSRFSFKVPLAVAAPQPPVRDLGGLTVGLALPRGSLRRELAALLKSWNAQVLEAGTPGDLAMNSDWELGIVSLDEPLARDLSARTEPLPGLPPHRMVGLVPISLSSEWRTALRTHFRLLVNKPVHHAALFGLISGSRTLAPFVESPITKFGFRVLVVEDNPMNQRLLERVLFTLGCPHTVVDNGRRAVEELARRTEDFDLVVMDLHMPEMDGISAVQEIRRGAAGPRAQTMWIIALTADARETERTRGLAAGLNDYLTKPLRIMELQTALQRFRSERAKRKV